MRNLLDVLVPNSKSALGDGWESMAANLIAGYGTIPLVGTGLEIAEAIEFLVRAEWVTGVGLEVDGGIGLGVSNF